MTLRTNKLNYEKMIVKVCNYLEKNFKVLVLPCKEESEYLENEKTIYLCKTKNALTDLCVLLHEAGHALMRKDFGPIYEKYFANDFISSEVAGKRKYTAIDLVREETLAWEKGYKLAKELKLAITWQEYKKRLDDGLWTYIKFVNDKFYHKR